MTREELMARLRRDTAACPDQLEIEGVQIDMRSREELRLIALYFTRCYAPGGITLQAENNDAIADEAAADKPKSKTRASKKEKAE